MAAGSQGTDAVNVNQLLAADAKTGNLGTGLATALGGGATYDATTGVLAGPNYTVQGTPQTSVGGAITALDSGLTNTTNQVSTLAGQVAAGTVGIVQQATPTSSITVGAATGGTTLSVAGTAGARTITGLAPGTIVANGTDAVNGGQLFGVSQSLATALGGGATVAAGGGVTAPAYMVQGAARTNVGDALTALDTQTTADISNIKTNTGDIATNTANIAMNTADIATNTAAITGLTNGTAGLVRQATPAGAVTVAATSGGATVDITGTDGARQLAGLANGTVAAGSTQGVNGGQLFGTSQSLATALGGGATVGANGVVSTPSYTVQGVAQTGVGAAVAALDTQATNAITRANAQQTAIDANSGAITNLDGRVTTNTNDISTLANSIGSGSVGLVRQATPTGTVAVAGMTGGTLVGIAGTDGDRRLTGVAAGTAGNDAVNLSQLQAVGRRADTLGAATAQALGGGAVYNATNGQIALPSYTIQGAAQTNVGDALTALDTQTTTNAADITTNTGNIATNTAAIAGLNNGTAGLVRQPTPAGTVTVAAATGGTTIDISGTDGNRQLVGLANGSVAAGSTEGVNGGQLFGTAGATAGAFGSGSTVTAGGAVTAPAYMVQGATRTNVGDALTALDTQTTTNTAGIATNSADISSLANALGSGSVGLVRQASPSAVVTVASATGGTSVDFTGTDGNRVLTGIGNGAIGATSGQAVNGSQLFAGNTSLATALGGGATVGADGTVSAPSYAVQGTTQTSVGSVVSALDNQVTTNAAGIAANGTAITGLDTRVSTNTTDIANNSTAISGLDARVTTNSADIANLTGAVNSGSVGLVRQSAPTAAVTVAAASGGNTVDFTGTNGSRVLAGVGNGSVTATSTQAVNGSQLFSINGGIAKALGGGATVGANGVITAPSYVVQGMAQGSVGDALTVIDDQVTTNTTDIASLSNAIGSGSIGLVQQTSPTAGITVGATTGGGSVSVSGTDGDRQVTGVAAGAVGTGSTDAVNGAQLAGTALSVASALGGGASVDMTGQVTAPSYMVQGVAQNSVGGAISALDTKVTSNSNAIAGLTTNVDSLTNAINSGSIGLVQQTDPNGAITVALGTGGTSVDFAGTAGDRVLTGVAAGTVAAGSTDAVNGSQLANTNARIQDVADLVVGQGLGGFTSDNSSGAAIPQASGADSSAGGAGAVASGQRASAVGNSATASGPTTTTAGSPMSRRARTRPMRSISAR